MRHVDVMRSALARCAGRLETVSEVAWRLAPATPDEAPIDVRLDGEWLSITTPLVSVRMDDDLLAHDGACPGAARVVIATGGTAAVAADVALDAALDVDLRIADACRDVARAWRGIERGAHASDPAHD